MDYRFDKDDRGMDVMDVSPENSVFVNQDGILQELVDEIRPSKVAVLVDENTSGFCLPLLFEMLDYDLNVIQISSGEKNKTLDTCKSVWKQMLEYGLDRHSLLINLGGGVICDMGGFCASTYMRGIPFIHMPTTLMSQADAAIGGKQGVDFDDLKNIIGVFNFPHATIICTDFLQSLPYRQVLSGYAEVVKSALISDPGMWNQIIKSEPDLRSHYVIELITKTIGIKQKFVETDPLEKNRRKALNFGHTIGHAIETHHLREGNEMLHGEAIAIGMVVEAYLSVSKGYLSKEDYSIIKSYIKSVFGDKYKSMPTTASLIETMQKDKKNKKGKIMFTLLDGIGNFKINQECSYDEISHALKDYLN